MASALKASLPDDRQTIHCLYCRQPQEISRKAVTITCRHCHKSLRVEDVTISKYEARRAIDTLGVITVEKRGNVVAERLQCGGLVVRGKVKAEVVSRGPVLVGPEAEIRGNVTAPRLAVGAGAVLEGDYRIGPE
ncbi:MAG: polymer-forming cytoskeletal protein [Phycisphaerae bacterium]|nr:polymer-forming cytoskeletal protein [Phycisphaerae bacterium]MDW8261762.1 polymer-forming cytoskeletal protein [Phycisphaerales bacterium]